MGKSRDARATRQHGQQASRRWRRGLSIRGWLRLPVVLLPLGQVMLAGCASESHTTGDPLLGEAAPRAAATQAPGPPTGPRGPLPSQPAPTSLTSNAALAGTITPATGDPNHDLRIADASHQPATAFGPPPGSSPVGTPATTFGPPPGSVPGPATTFGPPPAPGTPVQSAPALAPAPVPHDSYLNRVFTPANGSYIISYEQAQATLAVKGVSWQRLETWGDNGWKFSCSIPNPKNKFISRTYEGQARDYLSAIRAVLDQINKDQ